jgi:hypothetical protein
MGGLQKIEFLVKSFIYNQLEYIGIFFHPIGLIGTIISGAKLNIGNLVTNIKFILSNCYLKYYYG